MPAMKARFKVAAVTLLLLTAPIGRGQTTESNLHSLLAERVEPAATSKFQMEQFLSKRITPLPSPKSASEWTEQEERLRKACIPLMMSPSMAGRPNGYNPPRTFRKLE